MRKIVYFDCETTGTDPYEDRIVEIAFTIDDGTLDGDAYRTLVNPKQPIPAEATAVHGIRDEDVADAPTFNAIASRVEVIVADAVLVGYGSRRFDVPLLHTELRRAGKPGLSTDELGMIRVPEIDLYEVWSQLEPRNLTSAAARFAGVDHAGDAHGAEADTAVLPAVMWGMVRDLSDLTPPEEDDDLEPLRDILRALMKLSRPDDMVDRDGKFRRTPEGGVVFAFGQHEGKDPRGVPDYLKWMIGKDFSPDTKAWCRRLLAQSRG